MIIINYKDILLEFIDKSINDKKIFAVKYFNKVENKITYEIAKSYFEKTNLKSYIIDNFDNLLNNKKCNCLKITNFYIFDIIEEGIKWLL